LNGELNPRNKQKKEERAHAEDVYGHLASPCEGARGAKIVGVKKLGGVEGGGRGEKNRAPRPVTADWKIVRRVSVRGNQLARAENC